MAARLGFLLGLFLLASGITGCSIDGRKLRVTAGPDGGTSGSSGVAGTSGISGTDGGMLAAGAKCGANSDCASGSCLDGVCCGKACDGACLSCASTVTGQAEGTCAPAQAGTDPHDDCTKSTDACGLDGQCDGAGACRFAVPSTSCGTEACQSNEYTPAAQCDGAGKCVTPSAVSCGGQPCIGTRCDITCSATMACPTGFYCDGTTCAAQKSGGSMCAADGDCATGHCAEGVCCDGACTATCNSCLQANTGQIDGKCSAVRAGVVHGTDCPGSAACPAGATSSTAAPTCDGAGACKAGAATSCGNYLCNATTASCGTGCTVSSQCSSSSYCSGGVCKAKSVAGQLCAANTECQSGTCSGRCCSSGTPCMCPQPSAGNLIKNPGFDTSLAGWTVDPGPATIDWQPGTFLTPNGSYADANACAFSGSAYISEPDSGDSQLIWQCVNVVPQTDYNFGVQIATLSGAYAFCDADLYAGPSCTGGTSNAADYEWLNVAWSSGTFPTTFNTGFNSTVKISCHVEMGGSFFFDDIYLTPAPGMY
ncbi:MAG TPA: hypothetical protein VK745_02630 [Polyangiaceae bacterium]|nr:hypothetical protein [Polyangiaceae bacterium]